MSRRMADDLKRIIGIDNKSRPLEKRDPLPRVMGGYGVSIIEGETQPVEPVVAAMPDVYVAFTYGLGLKLLESESYLMSASESWNMYDIWHYQSKIAVHSGDTWGSYSDPDNFHSKITKNGVTIQNYQFDYAFGDSSCCANANFVFVVAPDGELENLTLFTIDPINDVVLSTQVIHNTSYNYSLAIAAATDNYIHIFVMAFEGQHHLIYDISTGQITDTLLGYGVRYESASAWGSEVAVVAETFPDNEVHIFDEGSATMKTQVAVYANNPPDLIGCGITPDYLICTFLNSREVKLYDRSAMSWSSLGLHPNESATGGSVTLDQVPRQVD